MYRKIRNYILILQAFCGNTFRNKLLFAYEEGLNLGKRETDTQIDVVVGLLEWYAVLVHLAQEAIGTQRQVEPLGMQVESHAAGNSAGGC